MSDTLEPVVTFRFIEFNPRRAARGAVAARVAVLEDGEELCWMWMTPKDIRNNLDEFGESEELRKALAAYPQRMRQKAKQNP
jgi:hypothetical protein